jgi:hypothetical protein
LVPAWFSPRHRFKVYVGDPERAARVVQLRERHIAGQPEPAVHLDRAVDDLGGGPAAPRP